MSRVLLLDNYDSFTWNLAQYLQELGCDLNVILNDQQTVDALLAANYDGVVISPGPGRPDGAGVSLELLERLSPQTPLLGVCLGHQALAQSFGASIVQGHLMHGKTSPMKHDGRGVFKGIAPDFEATRYHSLVIDPPTLPAVFEVSARTEDGAIMGIRHREQPWEGVQFHPESILTQFGKELLQNFLDRVDVALSS